MTVTVHIGGYYELTNGTQARSYYHHNDRAIAMRDGSGLHWLLADHLGSTTVVADAGGTAEGALRYSPFGVTLSEEGTAATDRRFTGQRWQDTIGLYDYRARWYDPALGRFISADTLVPEPGEPQSLNRFSYAYNNPQSYVDPDGHFPFSLHVLQRVVFELTCRSVPVLDRMRRDQVGGTLVTQLWPAITAHAAKQQVDATVVAAILRHEGAAVERRSFTVLPTMTPGALANVAEATQVLLRGEMSSVGPGQMQVRRARELERLGYVPGTDSDVARVAALLDDEGAVPYIAGMVRYLSDRLHTIPGFSDLSAEEQQRLLLIGYNLGWDGDKGLRANIETHGYRWVIDYFWYDNQTLDEYLRWGRR